MYACCGPVVRFSVCACIWRTRQLVIVTVLVAVPNVTPAELRRVIVTVAVAADWRPRAFLALAVVLNVVYWIVPQGLGGIFAGDATDPNAAPLFVLLAYAMYPVVSDRRSRTVATEGSRSCV